MKIKIILIIITLLAVFFAINSCTTQTIDGPDKNVVKPTDPNTEGLALVADLPLGKMIMPMSVKDVVEHRSALHGKQITVKGYVVEAILGEDACPTGNGGNNIMEPTPGGCARPRIFVADTKDATRDIKYDLMILVSETEDSYEVGQQVKVTGIVSASKVAVVMDTMVF